jgi:hypothetical protein
MTASVKAKSKNENDNKQKANASRQVSLRMPEKLWYDLVMLAERENRSLNRQIIHLLQSGIQPNTDSGD